MTDNYILATDPKARDRLSIQHQFYLESSLSLLEKANLRADMSALEIGCGAGDMTLELAKFLKNGTLLSIDRDVNQLDFVRNRTREYSNIRFQQADVNELSQLNQRFDFIYCRMVLHHLSNAEHALLQMQQCLKPGGFIICEEPSLFDSAFCFPPSKAWQQYIDLVKACFKKTERDYEIAYRMEAIFLKQGLKILHHSLYEPIITKTSEKMIFAMGITDLKNQIVNLGLASEAALEDLKQDLLRFAKAQHVTTWVRMHQIIVQS